MKTAKNTKQKNQWRIRCFMESAHILGYRGLLSRPRTEINAIWEPLRKKEGESTVNRAKIHNKGSLARQGRSSVTAGQQ